LEHERITADLLQRNKHLQQFNYIVSHNLCAQVANIMGLVRLFSETRDLAHKEDLVPALSQSVNSLDNIIRDLNKILAVREQVNEKKEKIDFRELVEILPVVLATL
jgi:light-regulated signal transduction histidine kinase (bacteriophytochrome)